MKKRDSNIELLRIIAMCLIIFHHMALNTGIVEGYNINTNMIFGIIGGIGGKIGVVVYILITGYFCINKDFSFKKVFTLWLQIFCYSVGFMLIFRIAGIEKLNKVDTIKTFFPSCPSTLANFYLSPIPPTISVFDVCQHQWK